MLDLFILTCRKPSTKLGMKGLYLNLDKMELRVNSLVCWKTLNSREQRIVLNGESSDWGQITSGVPQGSVLDPLLFLVYINGLEEGIKSSIIFFADDTSLFSIVRDPLISAEELNHDLKLINKWAFQWKMSFNPDPTKPAEEIIFSHRRDPPVHPPLFFNDIEVKQVNGHNHLGLILDSKEKISKANNGVGVIKYLSSYVPVKTLDQIYKMYVRPHLDFCDVIYHIPEKLNHFNSKLSLSFWMEKN